MPGNKKTQFKEQFYLILLIQEVGNWYMVVETGWLL